jgi:sugar O-acyltransferase (sialic acid O-acetyltransferase NeuD family)
MRTEVAIYGSGGSARETAWLVESCSGMEHEWIVVCFVDDDVSRHGTELNGVPITSLSDARRLFPHALMLVAVGSPEVRRRLAHKGEAEGFQFTTVVHPSVLRSQWVAIGVGSVVCGGSILTTNVRVGDHVQINIDCTISHDVVLGDFTTLTPGVHLAGWVHCGQEVYIGTGANVINGSEKQPLHIGDGAVVGAGACVTRSVPAGTTVVGVPAKIIERRAL